MPSPIWTIIIIIVVDVRVIIHMIIVCFRVLPCLIRRLLAFLSPACVTRGEYADTKTVSTTTTTARTTVAHSLVVDSLPLSLVVLSLIHI